MMTPFCSEYNLVVSTHCGNGRDYALRRISHPVTVPQAGMRQNGY